MPSFTLRLTGNATIIALAEQADLRIASSSQGPGKQLVSEEVLTTARYIEDMLQRVQAQNPETSPAHWSQTSLSMQDWIEHVPLHLAQGQDIVVDHCEILGPTWVLSEASEERYKSQLRIKAAKDARTKAVDYCQVTCPGHNEVVIVPTEMGSENVAGGLFSAANRFCQPQSTSFNVPQVRPALSSAKKETHPSYTPQETKMTLSADFVFTVETNGFKLSSMLNETGQSLGIVT
ncbi:hypothetical protein AMS68_002866 [Peltaster fructicola]|uniref:Uncharacterized protein n=1 Tax=Peltaster fructicola TaxID=286661 RepID=A0A6H0XRU5_9PEZI|nr:hypothetical protein AMS68_002866 [Peltaster fructicola]